MWWIRFKAWFSLRLLTVDEHLEYVTWLYGKDQGFVHINYYADYKPNAATLGAMSEMERGDLEIWDEDSECDLEIDPTLLNQAMLGNFVAMGDLEKELEL